ncbi:P0490D09.15 [Oryza sativa (japonica cultivar-group)]
MASIGPLLYRRAYEARGYRHQAGRQVRPWDEQGASRVGRARGDGVGAASASPATQEFDDGANTGLAGRVLAQCAAGRAPADCVQCLQDSARAMPRCCWNTRGLGESVAVVLSDDCVLQFTMHLAYLRRQALVELSVRLSSVPLEQQR